jgi:hypothetical protein
LFLHTYGAPSEDRTNLSQSQRGKEFPRSRSDDQYCRSTTISARNQSGETQRCAISSNTTLPPPPPPTRNYREVGDSATARQLSATNHLNTNTSDNNIPNLTSRGIGQANDVNASTDTHVAKSDNPFVELMDSREIRNFKAVDPPGTNIDEAANRPTFHNPSQNQAALSTPAMSTAGHENYSSRSMLQESQPVDSFDSDNAIVDEIVELYSTSTSSISADERAFEYSSLRKSASIDSAQAVKDSRLPILPPRPLERAASPGALSRSSFDSMNYDDHHEEGLHGRQSTPLEMGAPRRNFLLPSPAVYSRQLSSPLRDSLIHAMSPMLSEDTDDGDSASYASSQNKRQNGEPGASFKGCSFLCDGLDLAKLQENLQGWCRF